MTGEEHAPGISPRGHRTRTALIAVLALSCVLAAAAPSTAAPSGYSINYTFTGGAADLNAGSGPAPQLGVISAQGGTVQTVTRDAGDALRFPARCLSPGSSSCARAVVQTVTDSSSLNPGTRVISFGATVRLAASATTDGENIVQKGYSTEGSQYKLQVDGIAGMPSCVVTGSSSATIYLAKSSISIADGLWHLVSCQRTATDVAISVDGVVRGQKSVPASLSITNDQNLRIGGKGASANNDQFNGDLDDVWVSIGMYRLN